MRVFYWLGILIRNAKVGSSILLRPNEFKGLSQMAEPFFLGRPNRLVAFGGAAHRTARQPAQRAVAISPRAAHSRINHPRSYPRASPASFPPSGSSFNA